MDTLSWVGRVIARSSAGESQCEGGRGGEREREKRGGGGGGRGGGGGGGGDETTDREKTPKDGTRAEVARRGTTNKE